MGRMRAVGVGLVASAISAAALCVGAAATDRPPSAPNGSEPIHTALWPAVAAQLAKNIATASFAHDYGRVWAYLHPTYQKAVSEAHWHKCQGAHPAAPPSVKVTKVAVANAAEVPISLALLGRRNVQEIQLLVRFTTSAASGPQLALLYTFWLKQGGKWLAVWPSDEYEAYKGGKCYVTPQGPPLY